MLETSQVPIQCLQAVRESSRRISSKGHLASNKPRISLADIGHGVRGAERFPALSRGNTLLDEYHKKVFEKGKHLKMNNERCLTFICDLCK